jgi:hypothetical protein
MQLQAWLKDGTAVRTELSMDPKVLKPDPERLQSRVETDPEHARQLAEVLERGEELRPVVVFQDPESGKYLLADGFHRHWAYRKHKRPAIPAYVVKGSVRDAIEFSASANLEFSKSPTIEDRKKAARMLLTFPEWHAVAASALGAASGISGSLAQKVRKQYFLESGIPEPEYELKRVQFPGNGQQYVQHRKRRNRGDRPRLCRHGYGYRSCIDGKYVHLGSDKGKAEERLDELCRQRVEGSLSLSSGSASVSEWLVRRGVNASVVSSSTCVLGGIKIGDAAVVVCPVDSRNDVLAAIGRAILISNVVVASRAVVAISGMAREIKNVAIVIGLAKQLPNPIEFMTPEELVAEFGPKGDA